MPLHDDQVGDEYVDEENILHLPQEEGVDRELGQARGDVVSLYEQLMNWAVSAQQSIVSLQSRAKLLGAPKSVLDALEAAKQTQAARVGQALFEAADEIEMVDMFLKKEVAGPADYAGDMDSMYKLLDMERRPYVKKPGRPPAAGSEDWRFHDAEPMGQDPAYNVQGEPLPEDLVPTIVELDKRTWFEKLLGLKRNKDQNVVAQFIKKLYGNEAADEVLAVRADAVELQPWAPKVPKPSAAVQAVTGRSDLLQLHGDVPEAAAWNRPLPDPTRGVGGHTTLEEALGEDSSWLQTITAKLRTTFADSAAALQSSAAEMIRLKVLKPGLIKANELVAPLMPDEPLTLGRISNLLQPLLGPDVNALNLSAGASAEEQARALNELTEYERNVTKSGMEGVLDPTSERPGATLESMMDPDWSAGPIKPAPAEYAAGETAGGTLSTITEALKDSGVEMTEFTELLSKVPDVEKFIATNMAGDISLNVRGLASKVGSYVKDLGIKTMKGAAIMPPLIVLGALLDKIDPRISGYMVTSLTIADLIVTQNPLGVIMLGASEVWKQWSFKEERKRENLVPQRKRGSRFGYVRKGNTWYPASLDITLHEEGWWDDDDNIKMDWGDAIYFNDHVGVDGTNMLQPFTTSADGLSHSKQFHVTAEEMGNEYDHSFRAASKENVREYDKLRNWYFLSDEEVHTMMTNPDNFMRGSDGQYIFTGMKPYEEDANLDGNAYERQIDDWRQVTELMHDNPSMNEYEASQMDSFDVTKALREAISKYPNPTNPAGGWKDKRGGNYNDWVSGQKAAQLFSQTDATDAKVYNMTYQPWENPMQDMTDEEWYESMYSELDFYRHTQPENEWLLSTADGDDPDGLFFSQVQKLQETQKAAAAYAGFEEQYNGDPARNDGQTYKYGDEHGGRMGNDIWASLYLDTSHSRPTAQNYEDLKAQLDEVHGFDDRDDLQKAYLSQKAITRYWLNQIGLRGGSQELLHQMTANQGAGDYILHGITGGAMGAAENKWKGTLMGSSFDYDRIMDQTHAGWDPEQDPYDNDWMYNRSKPLEELSGWVMPWQNAGESMFGDAKVAFTGSVYGQYDRFSKDAEANVAWYIKTHGKVDPNMLDGVHVPIEHGGILTDMTGTVEMSVAKAAEARILFGLVQTPMELAECPQLDSREFFREVDHPVIGKIKVPAVLFNYSEAPYQLRFPAPTLGQHNQEIYVDGLGYSQEDFCRLRQLNAI